MKKGRTKGSSNRWCLTLCFISSLTVHGLLLAGPGFISNTILNHAHESTTSKYIEVRRKEGSSGKRSTTYTAVELEALLKQAYHQNPLPKYPPLALKLKYEGVSQVKVKISDEGKVEKLELIQKSGFDLLDQSVLNTLHEWEIPNPKKISVWMTLPPFRFKLRYSPKPDGLR